MLKFYFNGSPNPTKVALFLEEAGIPHAHIPDCDLLFRFDGFGAIVI